MFERWRPNQETAMDDRSLRLEGLVRQLGAVYWAARGLPVGLPIPNPTDEELRTGRLRDVQEEQQRLLARALFVPKVRVRMQCPDGGPRVLAMVYDRRLVVVEPGRPAPLLSDWTPRRFLVVDRQLLAREGSAGFSLSCDGCGQTHLIDLGAIRGASWDVISDRRGTGPPPPHYPMLEEAAFCEVVGSLDIAKVVTPDAEVALFLTPFRQALHEKRHPVDPLRWTITGQRLRYRHSGGGKGMLPIEWSDNPSHRVGEHPPTRSVAGR